MRRFNIILTTNNKSGPFDIYYTSEGENVLAPLVSGNYATNISSSQLVSGVNILADYGVSNIYVVNNKETCQSIQNLPQTPQNNPYTCINLISKNNCGVAKDIQYIDCEGNTQTLTINAFSSVSYKGKINTTTCISSNCTDCITTIPDPQYCKYYSIRNPCTDVAVDIKYIDCSGVSKVVKIGPNQTIIIQAIADTVYNYGGNCGIPPDIDEIPDPYNPNPNATCKNFIAVNKCSIPAIISYTDCNNDVVTLDIPAGASIPYSSFSSDYKCISGDCSCLKIYTPIQACEFDFLILGEYTPTIPPVPSPKYSIIPSNSKFQYKEGDTITLNVENTETTNIINGVTLYWRVFFYTLNSNDIITTSGSVVITNNKGSFNIIANIDNVVDANKFEIIFVRLYSTSNTPDDEFIAETKAITIEDTTIPSPLKICGVRAYDTSTYRYSYTANHQAIPPNLQPSPTLYYVPGTNNQVTHDYKFFKDDSITSNRVPVATTALTTTQFPYVGDFPWITSQYFTGSVVTRVGGIKLTTVESNILKTFTSDNRGNYVYPLNNQILTWENNTRSGTDDYYSNGFISDVDTSIPWVKNLYPGGGYTYIVPRNSTYALTGSISFTFRGNDTGGDDQQGPAVFRIFGVLEKSTNPQNPFLWTRIGSTTMSQLDNNTIRQNGSDGQDRAVFAYNMQQSLIWFDFDMVGNVQFDLKAQTDAVLSKGEFVRFTLYWQDINGVFLPQEGSSYAKRGANDLKFTIGNPSKPSMFSIIDKTLR